MKQEITKKQRILDHINASDIELFPKQIANKTGINHSTVKNYCRTLLRDNKIIQPYRSSYASKITHGMMIAPIKVHNVILNVDAPYLTESDDVVEKIGNVKVRVQFGLQRKKITIRLSCNKGMSRDSLLLALNTAYGIIEAIYGIIPQDVVLKTFELNRDIDGIRIDGVKCYTRKGFDGFIERIYQKDGSVRSEVKVTGSMTIDQLEALLMGGVSTSNIVQTQFMLLQEVKKLTRAIIHVQEQNKSQFELFMSKLKKE